MKSSRAHAFSRAAPNADGYFGEASEDDDDAAQVKLCARHDFAGTRFISLAGVDIPIAATSLRRPASRNTMPRMTAAIPTPARAQYRAKHRHTLSLF